MKQSITKNHGAEILFSEFQHVRSKSAQIVTYAQFVERVSSDEFKARVLEYRRLKALPGQEGEAQRIKSQMPCIIPAATCEGGHAVANAKELSGLLCIDLDHTAARTGQIKKLLKKLPWVKTVFISISGEGVKIFVLINPLDAKRNYTALYTAVGECISRHVGHPYDKQCKALTQPCYYSWDEDVYCNPNAIPFEPEESADTPVATVEEQQTPAPQVATVPCDSASKAEKRMLRFLKSFDSYHPFVSGSRNDTCLKLGRAIRSNFFSKKDLETISTLYSNRNAAPDFTEKEIRQRIFTGYQYVEQNDRSHHEAARVQERAGFGNEPSGEEEELISDEDVLNKNDELRTSAPVLPASMFELLPSFLQRCVTHADDPRERDILLLGALTACSALFPNTSFFYKNALYSPNLYLAVVAPAGAGKGALTFSNTLLNRTDEYYQSLRNELLHKFEVQNLEWENETRNARKEKRKANFELKPTPTQLPYFKLSATTSKSRLIESLAANGDIGCIMTSTEIATLTSALRQDFGGFDDILLKAFHHEEISSSYKSDGEPLVARNPHLSVCLSGTQEQFASLFRSLESGLYSRFLFYTRAKNLNWVNCGPQAHSIDLKRYYAQLGEELFEMHTTLLESPTLVSFTAAQWEKHTETFTQLLQKISAEGAESTAGIVLRCGLQTARLASILTVFRKWEDFRYAREYICSDTDFDTALSIGKTLLSHSLLLSTALPASKQPPRLMRKFYRLDEILAALPAQFTYTDFVHQAIGMGMSRSGAKRLLNSAVDISSVEKSNNSYRKCETTTSGTEPRTF